MPEEQITKHFSREELQCKCGCKQMNMDPAFLKVLEIVREAYGISFRPTSAYRCHFYNDKISGHDSAHPKGCGGDIPIPTNWHRDKLLKVLFRHDIRPLIRGIGIALGFIHIDTDFSKLSAVWLYPFDKIDLKAWKSKQNTLKAL